MSSSIPRNRSLVPRRRSSPPPPPPKRFLSREGLKYYSRRYWRWLLLLPVFGFLMLFAMYLTIAIGFTAPSQIILGAKGIEILDRNGELVYTFSDEPGSSKIVSLNDVSPDLVNATLATEDANFWQNSGVNVKGMLRAAYENLAFWNGGFFHGSGGSSISQQLAKNLYIKPEERAKRSPLRKVKETLIAFELTRRYSKEQILEWYLSNIFYGHGAYGIESASYRYFDKAPKDLTLAEATLLAGIPRAPSYYDPIADFDAATARQKQVVGLMVRHGYLTQQQADDVLIAPLALREGRDPNTSARTEGIAPHFAIYVRDLLPDLLGKGNVNGELRVTTTLDVSLQQKAEDIVTTQLDKFEKQYGATNGSLVAMDPRNGEILAMVGSHDFERDDISGQVNNAIALNQPGSTMKPITYLSAFMKGWAPSTIIVDEPITLSTGESNYVLNNADLFYRGAVPARTALGSSLNVPAVKTLQYAGLPTVLANAKKLGLTTLGEADDYGPAFTLGGGDVTLLDMTYAYSVFANQGEQAGMPSVLGLPSGNRVMDPIAVLKVESVDGKQLWKAKEQKTRVIPANATYLITNVLSDDSARVSAFGANSPLNLPGRPAAVKSGSSDASRDAWAIGYTPQLVTGVWVGNANNTPMPGATSTFTAAPIWSAFMQTALQGTPPTNFTVPDGIEFDDVCQTTGLPPIAGCPKVVKEVFLAGHGPAGAKPAPTATAGTTTVTATPTQGTVTPTVTPPASPTARATQALTPPPSSTPSRGTVVPTNTPRPEATNTPRPQATQPPPATNTPRPQATNTPRPEPSNTPRPQATQSQGNNGNGNGNNPPLSTTGTVTP